MSLFRKVVNKVVEAVTPKVQEEEAKKVAAEGDKINKVAEELENLADKDKKTNPVMDVVQTSTETVSTETRAVVSSVFEATGSGVGAIIQEGKRDNAEATTAARRAVFAIGSDKLVTEIRKTDVSPPRTATVRRNSRE